MKNPSTSVRKIRFRTTLGLLGSSGFPVICEPKDRPPVFLIEGLTTIMPGSEAAAGAFFPVLAHDDLEVEAPEEANSRRFEARCLLSLMAALDRDRVGERQLKTKDCRYVLCFRELYIGSVTGSRGR